MTVLFNSFCSTFFIYLVLCVCMSVCVCVCVCVYLYIIYLLGIRRIPQLRGRRAVMPKKSEEGKDEGGRRGKRNWSGQRPKPSTPTLEIDALIGEEEQKKETGSGSPTQLPWIIWSPLPTGISRNWKFLTGKRNRVTRLWRCHQVPG